MSGSNSSDPAASPAEGFAFTVHSMPAPVVGDERRTRRGRLKMTLVLLVCAAPVVVGDGKPQLNVAGERAWLEPAGAGKPAVEQ